MGEGTQVRTQPGVTPQKPVSGADMSMRRQMCTTSSSGDGVKILFSYSFHNNTTIFQANPIQYSVSAENYDREVALVEVLMSGFKLSCQITC